LRSVGHAGSRGGHDGVTDESARPELAALRLGDSPGRWHELGFTVAGSSVWLGGIELELAGGAHGISGWRLRGLGPAATIDGLETAVEPPPAGAPPPAAPHANGAIGLDHVVITTPDFDRTAASLARAGMPLRRVRDAPGGFRQGFRRLGPAILELVEARDGSAPPDAPPGPARFWGLVVVVTDLDALAERLGDQLGPPKDAVQPGRRIATLRQSAGLGEAVAFMTPEG
jgi:hypothetical protein